MKMPVLGMLPELDKNKIKADELHPERAYTEDEKSNFSETIRTIRTGLTLSSLDKPHKIILSTSSVPGEGKTTVSVGLAVHFAKLGKRTLIVECDIRRRVFNSYFRKNSADGIASVIMGASSLEEVTHSSEQENLSESLQVAADAGAKRLLLPMASVTDIPTIPGELFAKFQTSFYSDPQDAVFKAMGVQ